MLYVDEVSQRAEPVRDDMRRDGMDMSAGADPFSRVIDHDAILQAFESSPTLMGVVELTASEDDILHIVDNAVACAFFGLPPGGTASRFASAMGVSPETIAAWIAHYRQAAEQKAPSRFEYRYLTAAGEQWLNVAVAALGPGPSGAPRFSYVAENITARKRAEQAAREAEARSRNILESISDAFVALDASWRFTYVNHEACRVLSLTPEQLLGTTFWETFPGMRTSVLGAAYERTAKERVATSSMAFYPDHDRFYESRAYPASEGIVVYFRDVTEAVAAQREREQTAQQLEAMRRELDAIIEGMSEGLYITDMSGTLLRMNAAGLRVLGYEPASAVGRNARELVADWETFYPDGRPMPVEERPFARVARGEELSGYVTVVRRRASQVERILSYNGRIVHAQGRAPRAVLTFRDVTELAEVERTLRRRERELEALAEKLREADVRKDEFLAMLAHELRNPLAPIRTGLEVLKQQHGGGAALERTCAMMARQLGHMVRIIDDLLDVSRISRGKIELRRTRIAVQEALSHALEATRPLFESLGHVLRLDVPAEPIWLDGDLTRLAQVVSNLLNNAAKYTPRGGQIALTVARDPAHAIIRVVDDGEGIPGEMLSEVFDLFAQASETRDRAQGGLGIGLSLVKRLVEMHGGTVRAESPGLGGGSTFIVSLPLAPPAPSDAVARDRAQTSDAHGTPLRVLVVDDNVDAAEMLAMLLELSGHEIRTASTGDEALAIATTFAPAVIFLDIGLPDLDGYEVARQLRARPAAARPILAALTGWGSDDDKRRSREAGFDHHLTKPVDEAAIEHVLADARAAMSARSP